MRRLDDAAPNAEGRLDRAIDALGRALEALGEASSDVEAALEGLSFDPLELEQTEERLFALRGIARKHNILPDQLPEFAAEMQAKLTLISDNEANEAALIASVAKAEAAYHKAAKALTAKRTIAAKALDKAVAAELPELKMERAQFRTVIAATDPGIEGAEKIAFEIATNPGAPFGPLAQIASGGELSRFLLALKVALAGRGPSGVMVFDEIDRGVGGATADAVGRRLSRLAESDQVLVVTHSPQVAAKGDQHFRIQKSSTGEVTRTDVVALTGDEKRDEIARMLSGDTVTDAARAAAGELIS
jgi:DNA repair protein RecN (Recombination protein N)